MAVMQQSWPPPLPALLLLAVTALVSLLQLRRLLTRPEAARIVYSVDPPTLSSRPTSTAPTDTSTSTSTASPSTTSTAVPCHAPATGQLLGHVAAASPADIDAAVAAASAAQPAWASTSFAQRRAVLRSLMGHVLDHAHDICRVACLDSGKTMVDAQLGEVLVTVQKIAWTLAHGQDALRPDSRPTSLLMAYKKNSVRYEPMGVVAALVSWNYPFHNLMGPVISALFAGNAIVVKVSEQTAWSSAYFAAIARAALVAHGHDANLVQAIVCWPHAAAHLSSHPRLSHITFIGSRHVARRVAAAAAHTLVPLVAELGGKDAFVLLDSAAPQLDRIVEIILRGTFQGAGQNCIGIERVIASGALYRLLVARLEPRVRHLRLGPDADVGAMISDASFDRLEHLIADAVARGARLLVGGRRYFHPLYPAGHYFTPTLLVDVTPDMPIAQQECFAPILVLMPAASSSPTHMLALANSPDYGLGASVHAAENDPALPVMVAGLKAGMVAVNDFAAYYAVQLPFGGVAGSGYGRFAGAEGLRGLCNLKSVCQDRFAWLGIRTVIPPPVRYPVASQHRAWHFVQAIIELGYAGLARKLGAIARILRYSSLKNPPI
ncbi:hypothetical protein CDD81_5720 [Ophiocordyceps australis]|uniref:aldehyde dehydrogenase (NAD(+)) n=1 Tax=Ophiocordyceps australis TaxID=1399860 RepID=A0A2C5Y7C0_9HYPO|nr:hypothetical protein CDD81_5720 [Ophiocordyceps australis]